MDHYQNYAERRLTGGRGPIRGPAFCIPRGDSSTVTLGVPGGQDPAPRPDLCWRLDTLEVRLRPALLVYSASRFSGLELGSPGRVGLQPDSAHLEVRPRLEVGRRVTLGRYKEAGFTHRMEGR